MIYKRRLKIHFPFKIRPRVYLVLKITEEVVKKQKRHHRRRLKMKTISYHCLKK
jgi:hypothetical protein